MFIHSGERLREKLWDWWRWLVVWGPDLLLALVGLWVIAGEFPKTLPSESLYDFGSFIASGQAARDGLDPYGIYPPLTFHFVAPGFDVWNQNLNPPISALLFQVFTLGDPHRIFQIWYAISAACYGFTVLLLVRRFDTAPKLVLGIWAWAHAGVWSTSAMGNIYLPLTLPVIGAWLLLERGSHVWAGLLIGVVVALKPNFAVWPALLLLARYYRPAMIAAATAGVLTLLPVAFFGIGIYHQWFSMLAADAGRTAFLTNVSLPGLAARAGMPMLGLVVGALCLAAAAVWAWLRRPPPSFLTAIAIVVTLLATTVVWVNYTLFLLPVICMYWRLPGMRLVAAGLMITVGFLTRQLGQTEDVQLTLGSVHAWTVLLLFGILVAEELRRCGLIDSKTAREPSLAERGALPSGAPSWGSRGANILLVGFAVAVIAAEFPRTLPRDELLDFGSFYESGQAAGRGENPYAIYPRTFHVVIGDKEGWNPNLNPPISALVFQLFGLTTPEWMFRIWYCVNLIVYAAILLLLLRRFKDVPRVVFVVAACGLAGFWETLVLGQIYLPLVLAAVAAWLLLERGSTITAGILIGIIVAVKPNFAVWPTLLFLSGRFRPALVAAAAFAVISAIPLLVYGPTIYAQWLQAFDLDKTRIAFVTNASLPGLAARATLTTAGQIVSVILLLGAAAWAFTRKLSVRRISTAGLILSVLASPIGWVNYTLFLLPVFCWRWSSAAVRFAIALLIVPVTAVIPQHLFPGLRLLTLGSVYSWALLLLFCALLAKELLGDRFGLGGWRMTQQRQGNAPPVRSDQTPQAQSG